MYGSDRNEHSIFRDSLRVTGYVKQLLIKATYNIDTIDSSVTNRRSD